jgi:hypothetical protein
MLHVEYRQMFAINGLIDDFVLYGKPSDYIEFARTVESAIHHGPIATLDTASRFQIEVDSDSDSKELMTSLQNRDNKCFSMNDWEQRDILRVWGSPTILEQLRLFLVDLSGRGEGYSYLAEYSEKHAYHRASPEWRLHVLY